MSAHFVVAVNKRISKGQAPLHRAVRENCVVEVERLLSLGANIELKGEYGSTPLHVATYHNQGDSHFDTIKVLLENGADVNAQSNQGKTPLLHLVENAKLKTLELLLNFGADINKEDFEGKTPFLSGIESGNKDVVQSLIGYHDLKKVYNHDMPILHLAAEFNRGNSHL